MNEAATAAAANPIKEEDVVGYLQQHPDFFVNHDALLAELSLAHPDTGTAVSLIERQVGVMREEKMRTEQQLKALHHTAQNNEQLLKRLQHLIVLLIQSDSLKKSIGYLRSALLDDFHADSVVVHLYDRELKLPNSIDPADPSLRSLKTLIERNDCFCGRLKEEQKMALFGDGAQEISSAVVIPLPGTPRDEGLLGLIAIGSVDPARYSPDMGTVFINHLGAVINTIFISHMER